MNTLAPSFLICSTSFLPEDMHYSLDEFKFDQIGQWTVELAALERLEKSP